MTDVVTTRPVAPRSFKRARGVDQKLTKLQWLRTHALRILLEFINVLLNHDFTFSVIGAVNKRLKFMVGVFLVYPPQANDAYSNAYTYAWRRQRITWEPWPCGILWQDGRMSLMFCISATPEMFYDPQYSLKMAATVKRLERLRVLLGADQKSGAGVLPGLWLAKRLSHDTRASDLTARAVTDAIFKVLGSEHLHSTNPIYIIGGKGHIGRRVCRELSDRSVANQIIALDVRDSASATFSGRSLVVNIALPAVLAEYIDRIPSGSVVLNEVFPEPAADELAHMREHDIRCYHIVGVEARAFPSFPSAYHGGIPCCAAWSSPNMRVIVTRLM